MATAARQASHGTWRWRDGDNSWAIREHIFGFYEVFRPFLQRLSSFSRLLTRAVTPAVGNSCNRWRILLFLFSKRRIIGNHEVIRAIIGVRTLPGCVNPRRARTHAHTAHCFSRVLPLSFLATHLKT